MRPDRYDLRFHPQGTVELNLHQDEPHGLRAAARKVASAEPRFKPVVPRDSRSPRLQVRDFPLSARELAFGIRAARGPRRHDLAVMLHTGELPHATEKRRSEMAPIEFRSERRRPAAVTESGRAGIGAVARGPCSDPLPKRAEGPCREGPGPVALTQPHCSSPLAVTSIPSRLWPGQAGRGACTRSPRCYSSPTRPLRGAAG